MGDGAPPHELPASPTFPAPASSSALSAAAPRAAAAGIGVGVGLGNIVENRYWFLKRTFAAWSRACILTPGLLRLDRISPAHRVC